jgi:hypothetical protein
MTYSTVSYFLGFDQDMVLVGKVGNERRLVMQIVVVWMERGFELGGRDRISFV